jgi:death on curing protein
VILPTTAQLLELFQRVEGGKPVVRDPGALESAVLRPHVTVFGEDAYPTLDLKAAALMDGLNRSHALVDGNKRLSLLAVIFVHHANGRSRCTLDANQLHALVLRVADEHMAVEDLAAELADAFITP